MCGIGLSDCLALESRLADGIGRYFMPSEKRIGESDDNPSSDVEGYLHWKRLYVGETGSDLHARG